MSRFFVDPSNVKGDRIILDSPESIRHIVKVLRLTSGNEIDISDSAEWEYRTKITSIGETEICLQILDKQKFAGEPAFHVSLFQAIPKQSKMEVIVQKCVELGVFELIPVFTERTVVTDKGNFEKKRQRWQKISAEAVKQCRRGIIPEIGRERKLKDLEQQLKAFDLILFPYENEEKRTMKDCLRNLKAVPDTIALVIGPEGGFSDEEAELLCSWGAQCVSLGKTILRTETAGIAALAMIMYELAL